jgi:hypothetical protein
MMVAYSFYDRTTGIFSTRKKKFPASISADDLERNCPPGHDCLKGDFDPGSQRVDIALRDSLSGNLTDAAWIQECAALSVVQYQPARPSNDYEWNGRKWVLNAAARLADAEEKAAIIAIKELEARQNRRVRELLAKDDQILSDIDAQIVEHRKKIISKTDTSERR